MNNKSKVEVDIKEAKIKSIAIDLDQEPPAISLGVELLSRTGKTVSQFTMGTNSWHSDDVRLEDLDLSIYHHIGNIVTQLLPAMRRKINGIDKQLEAPQEA